MLTKLAGNENTFGAVSWAILAAVLAATLFGVINGLGVAYLRIPPLVMTLGMNTVLLGLTTYYTKGTPQGTAPDVIITLATKRIFGIPWALILWAIVSIAVIFMLRRTTLGANIYAIGNNVKAAYLSGVPVQRTLVICYALRLLRRNHRTAAHRLFEPKLLPHGRSVCAPLDRGGGGGRNLDSGWIGRLSRHHRRGDHHYPAHQPALDREPPARRPADPLRPDRAHHAAHLWKRAQGSAVAIHLRIANSLPTTRS
jgi:hypothetical protein